MGTVAELRQELCEAAAEMEERYRELRDALINIATLTTGQAHKLAMDALNRTGALQEPDEHP